MSDQQDWADDKSAKLHTQMFNAGVGESLRLLAAALREAWAEGYQDAAADIEEPYPPDIKLFASLSDDEVKAAVEAMGGEVSGRLHAMWARHWANVLRRRSNESK